MQRRDSKQRYSQGLESTRRQSENQNTAQENIAQLPKTIEQGTLA
jgi:hypothetical protein